MMSEFEKAGQSALIDKGYDNDRPLIDWESTISYVSDLLKVKELNQGTSFERLRVPWESLHRMIIEE